MAMIQHNLIMNKTPLKRIIAGIRGAFFMPTPPLSSDQYSRHSDAQGPKPAGKADKFLLRICLSGRKVDIPFLACQHLFKS